MCMCMCMCMCMYMYMYMYMYTYTCTCKSICRCTSICKWICICMCILKLGLWPRLGLGLGTGTSLGPGLRLGFGLDTAQVTREEIEKRATIPLCKKLAGFSVEIHSKTRCGVVDCVSQGMNGRPSRELAGGLSHAGVRQCDRPLGEARGRQPQNRATTLEPGARPKDWPAKTVILRRTP